MKLIFPILGLSLLLGATLARAQDSQNGSLDTQAGWGFAAGATSGSGIAYRKHFEGDLALQVAGIVFGDKQSLNATFGVHLMHNLSESERLRFYFIGGAGLGYDLNRYTLDDSWRSNNSYRIGAGIGMEFKLIDGNLGFSLDLPLTIFFADGNGEVEFDGIYPIPTAALIYYF